jgi:hypothetical protein
MSANVFAFGERERNARLPARMTSRTGMTLVGQADFHDCDDFFDLIPKDFTNFLRDKTLLLYSKKIN